MTHLHKVTAFILRPALGGPELLLIQHPYAGIQIPAGTVEPGEDPKEIHIDSLGKPLFLLKPFYKRA